MKYWVAAAIVAMVILMAGPASAQSAEQQIAGRAASDPPVCLVCSAAPENVSAMQDERPAVTRLRSSRRSPVGAFALSLVVPGLGHRYAAGGAWTRGAVVHAGAEIGLVLSLLGARAREQDLTQSFETLAVLEAGADLAGKSRSFFLNLGTYDSTADFREALLRTRNWDQLAQTESPAFQWDWSSEQARLDYRALRDDAETAGRRVTVFASLMVANRLLSGFSALVSSRRHNASLDLALLPQAGGGQTVQAVVRF
ncbi:MAG: hypothetical protein AAGI08_04365 [Bacteroidota bacterium]